MIRLLAVLLLFAVNAEAADYTLSLGMTKAEVFNSARFAFPDLAQTDGRAGCCDNRVWEDKHAIGIRFSASERIYDGFGIRGSLSYLGAYDVAFDVGGNFSAPEPGRCVEHGVFKFFGADLQATYSFSIGSVVVQPSAGISGNEALYHTVSRCDFQTFSDNVDRKDHRFSWSPVWGVNVKWDKWVAGYDVRRITLSNNPESQAYGQGRMLMQGLWIGREF